MGATIQLAPSGLRFDALLFGESPSRVIISVSPEHVEQVLAFTKEKHVPAADVGEVGTGTLLIQCGDDSLNPESIINLAVSDLFESWHDSLERKLHD